MNEKLPSDKTNGTKKALFFLLRAPAYHCFTFNLGILYRLKHKVVSLKLCLRFFISDAVSFLLKFFFIKMYGLFHFNTS